MGNKDSKILHSEQVEKFHFSSQHEKININNSLRNFENHQCSRPWSKISRRRWKNSTLIHPYQSCKTVWPVSQLESYFLPEFEVKNHHKDNNNNNNFIEQLPELNKGAFGTIFKVKNLDTNELFALKVISKSKIIENHLVEQVKEEVEIQRACGHFTFIAKCSSNWQSKNHLYIAIEYIGGGELRDLLINLGKLPVEIVKLYVAQIALAIDFLHNAGVIYRDLKPENLLLDADNANIKLIDFGLSKWLPYNCKTRTVCGTTNFMVFELTLEGRQADEAVSSIFHTVLFHRCLGKFLYSSNQSYAVSSIGFTDIDCDFIDLTYVCCSSPYLNRRVKDQISNFSQQLRSNESTGTGQISLEFFQCKKPLYRVFSTYFGMDSIPWEVWTVRLQLIALENEVERQICRERVGDNLTDKIIYISEVMNRDDFVPKTPKQFEIDTVFDTSLPDVQPYLFKMNYSISGPSSGSSVGSTMRKFIRDSLNL